MQVLVLPISKPRIFIFYKKFIVSNEAKNQKIIHANMKPKKK